MADGTIKIDIDIPVEKVRSDTKEVDHMVENIGKNAGKDMDGSFKKNAENVKREAKSAGDAIDKDLGKEHKAKIKVDDSEAKSKVSEAKHDLDELPKERKTKIDADNSDADRKINETKRKTNELPKKHNTDIDATDHTGGVFARIKSHFDKVNEEGKKTHSLFGTIFSANIVSNAAMGAFGRVKDALGGMIGEAKQYALEQQTMNATWLTLTNSASKGKAMVNQINTMAAAAQNSTHMVDQLSQKFYAINNSAEQTGKLTKAVLTLQDAFGQSDAAVENFGTQFAQMMANGKVSAQDMMSIVNTFPKLKPMLLDYERQIHHSKNMTMSEMSDLMSKGKIKSQDMINVVLRAGKKFQAATGNFTKTIPGMKRTVEAEMPRLLQAFEGPLTKMQSPIYGAVSKWVSSKKTEKEFGALGKTVSHGMNQVMKAFSGGKGVNATKALDNAINGINKGLKGVFGWISGHAKDLKTIVSSVASIGGQLAKAVWKDFASIITTIGNMFGITAKNGKASGGAVHVLAEALNWLAKQKWAIKTIAASLVTIATIKQLDHVAGSLFSIGKKGYHAYKDVKALRAGLKGVQDIKNFSKTEQGFVRIGSAARSAAKWARGLFSASKGGAGPLNGLLQSAHSAGGFKNLTTAGKIGTGLAGAGVAIDAGSQFLNAYKDRHNADKRSQDIGKGIGAGIGGGIGLYFGGPLGAALGAKIGGFIGKWGGEGVNQFTKGWQSQGKKVKPQNWVQWLGLQAHNSFSFFAGLGKKAINGIGKGINSSKQFIQKNGKELALTFADPWAGIPALILKNNPKARQAVSKFAKGIQNGFKGLGKWLHNLPANMHKGWKQGVEKSHKVMSKFWKDTSKGWRNFWKGVNNNRYVKAFKKGEFFQTAVKDMKSRWKSFSKDFSKKWNSTWRSAQKQGTNFKKKFGKTWNSTWKSARSKWNSFKKLFSKAWSNNWKAINSNRYVRAFKKGKFFSTALKDMRSRWNSFKGWLGKNWNNFWKSTNKWAKSSWNGTVKNWNSMWNSINKGWNSFKGTMNSAWKNFWGGLASIVKGWGKTIKDDFTGTINNVIGGVNDVIHALGGGKKTIDFLHFASGTDWKHKYPIPAILNDGTDSPQTHNRESIIHANGAWELLPDKTNLKRFLLPGDEVVNARDTAKLFGNAVHFASGSLPYGISLPSVNYSQIEEKALKRLQHINEEHLQLAKKEARRKQARDHKKDSESKKSKKKPSKHKSFTADVKKRKGSILVDTGLLYDSKKDTGKGTYINEKLFKRFMSYTKAKPIKVSKNSRIRYHDLPTKRQGKYYLVDSKWLTGAKNNTGKLEKLNRESYLKLLQFTKAERKYKLPKKKRKASSSRRRTTTRRRQSSGYSSRSYSTRRYSTRSYSTGGYSRVGASVSASVSGLKSVQALSKALKGLKGTHKVKVKASASGSKSITKLTKSIKKVAGKHKVKLQLTGTKTVSKLSKNLKILTSRVKSSRSALSKIRTSAKHASSGLKSLGSRSSSTAKHIKALYKTTKKSKFGSAIAKQAEKAVKSLEGKGNFAKAFKKLANETKKTLSKMKSETEKTFKAMWNTLKKDSSNSEGKIDSDLGKFGSKFKHQWTSIQSGVKSAFSRFWSSMKRTARDGLNDVLGVLNQAIGKIDTVVSQFGGSKNAVHKVARLATGTGVLGGVRRPITAPTLAILNDGNDSPETGNKEAIWDRNTGDVEVVPGRFTPRILKPGQEVFNATETALLGYTQPQHFATGTGALKELYHIAKNNWEHPQKTGQALFSSINGLTGAINQLAQGAKKKGENQGVKWWSQLWKMVDDKVNDGAGNVSGLLKEAIKVSKGKPYVWGAKGPDAFDCSGLVEYAARKLGINLSAPSGTEYSQVEHIPRSEARMNDLVFYGAGGGEHVGIVRDKNTYWSAHSPTSHPNIGYDSIDAAPAHPILFGRIRGYHSKNDKSGDVKANTKLQKQIKDQVGSGFWKTIQKIADKYGDNGMAAAFKLGGSVGARAKALAKAIKQAVPGATRNGLAGIIGSWEFESGGLNPAAVNPNGGASGLGQWLGSRLTNLKAYARRHHKSWTDPATQINFAVNGDGSDSATFKRIARGHGSPGELANEFSQEWERGGYDAQHVAAAKQIVGWLKGYARGGIVSKPELAMVGEGNAPESIIPWDPSQRSRAYQIMQTTLDNFKAQDGNAQKYQNQAQQVVDLTKTNAEIQAINDKFDEALAALGILTSQDEVIQVNSYLDKTKITEAIYHVMKRMNIRSNRNSRYNISGH
ncbi:phage tail tip lysozyme [Lactobacillus crispatus]|uniref:phage tail tip lysozyme n=1 Tax=Lactobacillus crispatus TaxID=47770 RepID=UPI00031979A8|nr:phage tail tip lysozyme [Lactobacillus crispatus]EQM96380.1 tape measure domain-containing protein [Lactobacillus crispatus MV-1A-US]